MALIDELRSRAEYKCELCGATSRLEACPVPPEAGAEADRHILACPKCAEQLPPDAVLDPHHWHCLNESMWSETPAVKVTAWRLLDRLAPDEPWARDALDMLYMDEETLAWAQNRAEPEDNAAAEAGVLHRDSNGAALAAGDTVTLIKDLPVKGAGFTAKRGAAVRNIALVPDNAGQIEGRVNGQQIVILTQYVKKSG